MKKAIIIFFSVILVLSVKAQLPETAVTSVRYTFLHVQDTANRSDIHTENMVLHLGKGASYYKSLDKAKVEADMRAGYESGAKSAGKTVDLTGARFVPTLSFYKNYDQKKIENVETAMNKEYIYDEPLPVINWTITPETKNIQELSCQKATASFRGRDYEAWFCSQIPYSDGPWKLNGLPGLILEAYDTKQEVVFRFAGLENVTSEPIPIGLAKDAIRTTAKELARLKDALRKNPSAARGGASASGSVKMESGQKDASAPKKKEINNPIERTQ
jgi:GLPGLI family protein